ncbi:type I-E CRISPR-associated protein Cas5/CasD [Nocardiopsis sp. NPDC049922]|uniref:type I-E CRISPR-associated protein Cas5/CasD n=1 Tax=Nocardiopsis sp. NPDC049922 TaxID=3155157 RepID=UPI0033EF462D
MSEVVALLLSGPLQSWGGHSRHTTRGTLTHPTKSGVVGLCAAALGRPRGCDLSDLAALRFGVRVDRPGTLLEDFHTISAASHGPLDPRAQRLPTSGGGRLKPGEGKVSRRQYLQDAVFVAALEATSEEGVDLVDVLQEALRRPRFPLYLGRRSCPPDRPVFLAGLGHTDLLGALECIEWHGGRPPNPWSHPREEEPPEGLPVVLEDERGEELLPDAPLPGPAFRRSFGDRPVRHTRVRVAEPTTGAHGAHSAFDGDGAMDLLAEGDG